MKTYNHKEIEPKWQARWREARIFATPELKKEDGTYILDMFPYPSGSGLHVGHLIGYTGSDIVARAARMQGKKVLHPMGWDAFGLPAENFALKTGVHPADSTAKNVIEYKRQLDQVGMSYDWDKELNTSDPAFYKWTQWLFSFLYERGLAYRKEGMVNWCPKDQTVLANEQVVGGRCERCGTEVIQKDLEQWYFKITDFADRLLADLDTVDWPEKIKLMQRNWIGKSEGANLTFKIKSSKHNIQVFTTRPDTIYGATYLVLAPEHELVEELTTNEQRLMVHQYQAEAQKKSELERLHLDKDKTGVWTGSYALHPLTGEEIPVWISDYVLVTYGTGAIMAVPAHDERDFAFAKAHNLPITQVIAPSLVQDTEPAKYRPDQPIKKGESVIVFIKHPTEEKYLGLDWIESAWGAKTLLTGTIDDLTPEETVLKEIVEETGYLHASIAQKLGVIDGLFYHLPKQTNKLVRGHVFLVELANEEKQSIEDHEAARHIMKWLTPKELKSFLTPATHQFALTWLEHGWQPFTEAGALTNSGELDWLKSEEATEKVIALLQEKGVGEKTTTYRLRDWLVSRQRYWGAPIPISYNKNGKEYLVPQAQLPVELPYNVAFSPTGQSPLMSAKEWREYTDPETGEKLTREADTLDTFVCSSWYYLRFPNPDFAEGPFDPELLKQWLPVDTYMGGAEHAVLHLLYARFITKALFDAGLVSFQEPFQKLRNQGSILGPDHQKMSKSRGNVISPDEVIVEFGADTLRTYELFMGPFDLEKPWDTKGMVGVRRFLEKVWRLQERVIKNVPTEAEKLIIHPAIKKVTEDIADFKFNTCVSTCMETVNALGELEDVSADTYLKLIAVLSPFAPHITEELWETLGQKGFASISTWPVWEEQYLTTQTWECPVQINGKVKAKLVLERSLDESAIKEAVASNSAVQELLKDKEILKIVVVPGRVVSYVVK
jgi:leucyl-tRNA synthetase